MPAEEVTKRLERKYQVIADAAGETGEKIVLYSDDVEDDLYAIAEYIAGGNDVSFVSVNDPAH